MEVVLHQLPEKPYHTCSVLVFHRNEFGDIYNVQNVTYSAKYGLFNCHDFYLADEANDDTNYNEDIVCWCYMDEITVEVQRCLKDLK